MTNVAQGGIDRARDIYEHRDARARELAAQGKSIVGYMCCYTPVELFTALDLVPFRIHGQVGKPLTQVDQYLETIMCPYVRSCFELALAGEYGFLSGAVIPHTCDAMHRIYDIWKYYTKPSYSRCITVPHMTHQASFDYFRKEVEDFRESLEGFVGRKVSEEDLVEAIRLHNHSRALLRELYELRKQDPPPVSGVEAMQVILAGMTVPVREFNDLLEAVLDEARARRPEGRRKPRLLVVGSEMDDVALVQLVEDCGAWVVMDDLCTGSRCFWQDVELTSNPLECLAKHYLLDINCPRTYKPRYGDYYQDMENRFGYLKEYIDEFRVNGVIMYIMRYCDSHEFDAPDLKLYLERLGITVIFLENEYSLSSTEQLRSRVEAFVEMIG